MCTAFMVVTSQSSISVLSSRSVGGTTSSLKGNNVKVIDRPITTSDVEKLKKIVGTYVGSGIGLSKIGTHGTGLHPPTEQNWHQIIGEAKVVESISPLVSSAVTSPSMVDLTTSSWFPPIGNQDGEGSCVAWAVGYYVKTFQEAKEHEWNMSEAQWLGGYYGYPTPAYQDRIISPDFIYHLIDGGVDQGSSFDDAINLVCEIGASSWQKMPYDPTHPSSWPSEDAWREAAFYRGNSSAIEYLMLGTDADLANLKNWIASENLAVIGVDAYQYPSLTNNDVWTLDTYAYPSVDHANTIVGYDDSFEYNESGQLRHGAFRIANSWGVGGWENVPNGCYWISYEAMKQRIEYCMIYGDLVNYEPKLLTSFHIDHPEREDCAISVGMGSHFLPIATKSFSDLTSGGNYPFPANNIVIDITDFMEYVSTAYNQAYFIKVRDGSGPTTGTITYFSVQSAVSFDTPVATTNGVNVYADVSLPGTIRVPSQYATIQAAINAAGQGMTIEVSSGTYPEDVVVNKTVQLQGENPTTTIIDGGSVGNTTVVTADNVTVTGFTITNGINGLLLEEVEGCKISENRITNSLNGLLLQDCSNNTLNNNTLSDSEYGFGVEGSELSHYMNSINSSNTIDGKPIFYLTNQNGSTVNSQSPTAGFLAFINSTDVSIQNVTAEHDYQGILLAYTHGSLVKNVTFMHNIIGLELYASSNNTIFHNSFVNNTVHAKTYGSYDNLWDEGYPEGGNYWDSYTNVDEKSGPHQDEPGSDGIGDVPWTVDENNVDNYPLMNLANADQIPPITHDDYDGLWHAQGFAITLTATDVWSGVAETYYRINDGLTQTVSMDGQPHINDVGPSDTLEYWSVDSAGNEELPHKMLIDIKCDDSAPTGSITINDGAAYATSRSVVLTLTVVDEESGVLQVRYSNDGVWDSELWTTTSLTQPWNLALGDGAKTIYFQIENNVGLLSLTYSDTIILDVTQPLIRVPTRVPIGDVQPNQSVTISANISDVVSGVKNATLYYSTDVGTTWTGLCMNYSNMTGFYEAVIQEQESGTLVEYKIETYDMAGNSFTFDQTEPYHVSQSVPAFPSIIVALLFMGFALVVFALIKRRNQ